MFVAKQNNSSKPSSSSTSKSNNFIQPKLKVVKSEDQQEATKNKKQEKNKKTKETPKFFAAKAQTKGLDTVINSKNKQKEEGKENSKEKETGDELVVKEVSTKQVTIESSSGENTIKDVVKGKGGKGLVEAKNKEEKQKAEGEKEKGALGKKVAEKTTPRNPKEDPNFKKLEGKLKKTSKQQQQHEDSKTSASVAQRASVSPENERVSMAQSGQVEVMAEAEPGTFNAVDFKAKLMKRIEGMQLPKNQDEAANFDENNNIDEVNQSATQDVENEKTAAAGPVEQTSQQEPNVGAIPQREVTPLPAAPIGNKPATANPKKAMPPKRGNAEVNKPLEDNVAEVDQQMAMNKVTDEQLEKSNEPSFTQGLDAKNEAKKDAATAPAQLRQKEKGVLQSAKAGATGKEQAGLAEMHQNRSKLLTQVTGSQTKTGGKDTSERTRIATEINKIYENSKTAVEKILTDLDTTVKATFKAGTELAKMKFENHVASKMRAYKARRYSGVSGKLKWVKDKFAGMPDEVNDFFVTGRKEYINTMDKVITKVAEYVATKLTEAKTRVTTGKQEVQEYVTSLPQNLQKLGKEAAEEINDKFDELEDSVNSKQDELIDSLAEQYMEGLNAVDARIEEMKAANRGLIDAALGFINGIIETIKKLRDLIATLLAEIQNAMDVIMEDPIGFVTTLFEGVGKGIDMFMANIQKHMLGGFVTWLTGAMGPVGITIPDNLFSLKGIFSLVMQVLGLSWDFVRKKSVLLMGEPMVVAMEKGFEMFQIIREKGVSGIWEYIKEQFTDLKETIIESIKSMLITQVIEAGIKWLLSLLIPGAGFIKAIMAIKDLIVFFVQSAIMLIPSLIQAIKSLASGNVAGVAKAIEKGLVMLLPLVISLFAKLIGLGGLVKKVQKIIKKVRKRIDRAVTKMIKKAKKKFKKLVKKGKAKVKKGVKGLLQWWKKKKKFKAKDGKSHTLYYKGKGKSAKMMVASTPTAVEVMLNHKYKVAEESKKADIKNAISLHKETEQLKKEIEKAPEAKQKSLTNDLTTKMTALSKLMAGIMVEGDEVVKEFLKKHLNKNVYIKSGKKLNKTFEKEAKKVGYEFFSVDDPNLPKQIKRAAGKAKSNPALTIESSSKILKEGAGTSSKPEHDNFIPKQIVIESDTKGKYIASYETLTADKKKGPKFTVEISYDQVEKGIPNKVQTRKVHGQNLSSKPSGIGRGKTDSASVFHNAHIIGDQFGGSGRNSSLNIHPSSPDYNTKDMLNVENQMAAHFKKSKQKYDLTATAKITDDQNSPDKLKNLLAQEFDKDTSKIKYVKDEDDKKAKDKLISSLQKSINRDMTGVPAKFLSINYKSTGLGKDFASGLQTEITDDKREKKAETKVQPDKSINVGEDAGFEDTKDKFLASKK
ncbi:DNA/RNA non-specific endonuclease [uncultured Tenacibaculum sp.]|uniref:DNA/RNA non-specific endonuclease n=1 Tax=uncultured Tenacibaculum sp. TaxID=174713 RepID=UPI00262A26D0|nr:DNA/RNA non-specific endonuclease [uncultured Tenacibaculum sp.]